MISKNLADYGIYPRRSVIKRAVDESKDASCRQSAISVLLTERDGIKEFAVKKEIKTSEGIATGVGAGTVVGGALGWLMGIGFLAIPGIGSLIATIDPIIVALAGASSGGLFGGIVGALITKAILQHEANIYEGGDNSRCVLIPIQTDEKEWKNISQRYTRTNRG